MNELESSYRASPQVKPHGRVRRFLRFLRAPSAEERYLAAATDTADLERRARALERGTGGPAFVTFNH